MTKKEKTVIETKETCHSCKCGFAKVSAMIIIAALLGGAAAMGLCRALSCGTKTVIVDFGKVQQESVAYQSILAEQRKYEERLQAQINVDFTELQKEDEALSAQKASLKEDEYQTKVVALQKKAAELQQKYQKKAQQIVAASRSAAEKIQADVEKTVEVVAKKNCAGVILNATTVVYANDKTNNITDDFIQALNENVKTVQYPDPETITLNPQAVGNQVIGE